MPKRGRSRKKNRTHGGGMTTGTNNDTTTSNEKVPKSLIIRRGKTCNELNELVYDLRRMMLPYTALNYKDSNSNASSSSGKKISLQHYSTYIALPMGITHIIQVSQSNPSNNKSSTNGATSNNTECYCNLRIARVPEGPTLYFRIHSFTLIKHIQQIQRKPIALNSTSITQYSPIVVTNNFGDHTSESHIKLLRITFQNLFPQINVSTIQLKDCRRVVLFNLIEQDQQQQQQQQQQHNNEQEVENTNTNTSKSIQYIEMRHYAIKATSLGMNRKVRRLLEISKTTSQTKHLPNLHHINDIADYITNQSTTITNNTHNNNDNMSDSEPEDDIEHHVQLSDNYIGVGNVAKQKSAIKLIEIGPRLTIQLLKVEKGLDSKIILYNVNVTKTKQEIDEIQQKKQNEMDQKLQRKLIQEQNVIKKQKLKEQKTNEKLMKILQQKNNNNNNTTTNAPTDDGSIMDHSHVDNTMNSNNNNHENENDDMYKIEGVSDSDDDNDNNDENNSDDDDDEDIENDDDDEEDDDEGMK